MSAMFWGWSLFFIFWITHLFIWKMRVPRRQVLTLFVIFLVFMLLGCFAFLIWRQSLDGERHLFASSILDFFHGCFLFTMLFAGYVVSYPAVEVDSPTFVIITAIANAGPAGLPREDLEQKLTNDLLVWPRLNDLITEGMIAPAFDEKYRITRKGRWFVRPFCFYRSFLGLRKGG